MGQGFPWFLFRNYIFSQTIVGLILCGCLAWLEIPPFYIASIFLSGLIIQILFGLWIYRPLGQILKEPLRGDEQPDEWFELQELLRRVDSKDLNKSEDKDIFEASLQALDAAVLIVDKEKSLRFWNQSLLKLSQLDNLTGMHLEEVFRNPDILGIFNLALNTGEMSRQKFPFRSFNQARHFLLTVVPLRRRSDSRVYGAVGIFNDITDIEKTEVMRIDFVANVSHELRTPLTSLKGYAQAIEQETAEQETAGNPSARKYAEIISRSVDRLIHLVNDLLDLSYLESGIPIDVEVVSTQEVTESVLVQLESARAQKKQNIKVHYHVEDVRADRHRLEQILMNLVQNAIKYIPENSLVEIIWERDGESVLLRVRDNGPGIDEEHIPRLFERFYRGDKARSPDKGGTGLGLAIVKHIMQRHGGSVSVNSQVGQLENPNSTRGTEFICRFPV